MWGLKKDTGYVYYVKPRSTEYKIIANLPDSNKGAVDDYFIVSGNWAFAPDEDLRLYPLSRTIFIEGNGKSQMLHLLVFQVFNTLFFLYVLTSVFLATIPQSSKDFCKSFFPNKHLKTL